MRSRSHSRSTSGIPRRHNYLGITAAHKAGWRPRRRSLRAPYSSIRNTATRGTISPSPSRARRRRTGRGWQGLRKGPRTRRAEERGDGDAAEEVGPPLFREEIAALLRGDLVAEAIEHGHHVLPHAALVRHLFGSRTQQEDGEMWASAGCREIPSTSRAVS